MMAGPVILVFDPFISFGLNDRSGVNGNKEVLALPVRAGFMMTPQLNVGASIGLIGPLDGFGDNVAVPLGAGATYAVSNMVDLRAQFTLTDLAGNSAGLTGGTAGAADLRAVSVGAAYRM
jgi:opacity protein-like surface antigen